MRLLHTASGVVGRAAQPDDGGDRLVAVVVVTTVVAAALGMVLVVRAQRRRHAAAEAWAQARAWDHAPDGGDLHGRYAQPPFALGDALRDALDPGSANLRVRQKAATT